MPSMPRIFIAILLGEWAIVGWARSGVKQSKVDCRATASGRRGSSPLRKERLQRATLACSFGFSAVLFANSDDQAVHLVVDLDNGGADRSAHRGRREGRSAIT